MSGFGFLGTTKLSSVGGFVKCCSLYIALETTPLKERLAQVEKQLEQVYQTIMDLIANDERLIARFEILTSISGISKVTAFSKLIEMPELGTMSRKQAACLAGLAPISRQSGRWQGGQGAHSRWKSILPSSYAYARPLYDPA